VARPRGIASLKETNEEERRIFLSQKLSGFEKLFDRKANKQEKLRGKLYAEGLRARESQLAEEEKALAEEEQRLYDTINKRSSQVPSRKIQSKNQVCKEPCKRVKKGKAYIQSKTQSGFERGRN